MATAATTLGKRGGKLRQIDLVAGRDDCVARARFDGATPKVGATQLRLEIENLEPGKSFWIAASAGAATSTTKVLGANVHVDLGSAVIVGPFAADGQGNASLPTPIPNSAGFGNAKFYMQLFSDRGNGTLTSSRGMWAGICK